MTDLPDPHRAEARRCVTLAGMPPPADEAARARRGELIDALAAAIAGHDPATCPACTTQRSHAAAADRLSWSGGEGLIITPPPADPS